MSIEHPFATFIRTIGKGKTGRRSLSQSEAEEAMQMILQKRVEPEQLGAFLMVLRVKEESAEEIAGFVQACRAYIHAPSITVDLDWSSYAGKRRQLPWYLLAALLLAQHGHSVFMHGASGHTPGRLYSEDVLGQLGVPIASDWQQVDMHLKNHHFAFMPLQHLCKPLHEIIELRPLLGLRSPVHTLSRLLNPIIRRGNITKYFFTHLILILTTMPPNFLTKTAPLSLKVKRAKWNINPTQR